MPITVPRDIILDQICVQLATIGTGGELHATTVAPQVMRAKHFRYALPQIPAIIVSGLSEEYTMTSMSGVYQRSLNIVLIYCGESQTQDDDAAKVIHDIEYVLSDHTLGNRCDDLLFRSSKLHASDSDEPLFFVEVNITARYRTRATAPGARV